MPKGVYERTEKQLEDLKKRAAKALKIAGRKTIANKESGKADLKLRKF